MKSFLRENPTIAFGLGLPLLLVVVFLLISGVPSLLVAPPQYDVLYATEYYDYRNGVQVSVVDEKVQVFYQSNVQGYVLNNQKPRLWRYNPKTGAVREITFVLPPNLNSKDKNQTPTEDEVKTFFIDVLDLEGLRVDSSSIAPDGYEFSAGRNRYSGDVFSGLFYSSRYGYQAVLKKSGRSVRLPNAAGRYYSRNTKFVGWVVSP